MWADEIQAEHAAWLATRYVGQEARLPLMGMIGEAGEAAHALLSEYKERVHGHNPRHTDHNDALLDALGDCVIYAMSWCNTVGERISGYDMAPPAAAWSTDPLDMGAALVKAACSSFSMGWLQQAFIDAVAHMCRVRGTDLETVTRAAWAQVKERVR